METAHATTLTIEPDDPIGGTAERLITALCREMTERYGAPPSPFSRAEFSEPRSIFLIAWIRGEGVGCGALRPLDLETAEIKRMYVAPKARRQGVARRILTSLEAYAHEFKYRAIRLETGIRQPEAQQLYRSMGFQAIAPFGPYVANPTSVCFEKLLSSSMTTSFVRIRRVADQPTTENAAHALAEALADVLIDCVEGGASIGFMHPLSRGDAHAFWQQVIASATRGERILLIAEETETGCVVGTVQVVLVTPPNQPHRADIAKMQVHRRARRQGVGAALMRAAEAAALAVGRTLLVLDTVTGGDAERLYTHLGWKRCGEIPGYALWPQGGYCNTTLFYRDLADSAPKTATTEDQGVEVIGIDHIYLAVSELARSEKFYDRVMLILGFRKNSFANEGDHHVQYYNRHFGIVLRPAHTPRPHDSLAPGLHHFCFRVFDSHAVTKVAELLQAAGISCSPPQLYPEYAPDYYATFFSDPDGIRLEVTNYRAERKHRHDYWDTIAIR